MNERFPPVYILFKILIRVLEKAKSYANVMLIKLHWGEMEMLIRADDQYKEI